jgi:hypothetical protein
VLLASSASPGRWPVLRAGLRIALVAGVLALAVTLLRGCGGSSAPQAGALPVVPGARVLAAAAGGSQVDTESNHKQYRYMAVSGAAGISGLRLLEAEVRFMTEGGWREEETFAVGSGADANVTTGVSVSTPGVTVELDSPGGRVHAALSIVANAADAAQQTDGTPLYGNAAIDEALGAHRAVLSIELGNGPHAA